VDGAAGRLNVGPGFRWEARPYTRSKMRGRAILAAEVVFALAVAWSMRSAVWGALAFGLLGASTLSFFVRTGYEILAEGLAVERLVWPWERFASAERQGFRMWLSRHAADSLAARLTSQRIELPEAGGDEVEEYVRARIAARG